MARPGSATPASAPAFESLDAQYLRRNWGILGRNFALLAGGVVLLAAGATMGPASVGAAVLLGLAGYLMAMTGLITVVFAWFLDEKRVPTPGHLAAGADGIFWNRQRMVARRDLKAGFIVPGDGHTRVRFTRRFPRKALAFVVPDEATGRTMLTALGLDAAQVTATLELASLVRARPWAGWGNLGCVFALVPGLPVALLLATEVSWMALPAALLGLFVVAWSVLTLTPARVQVGADGVLVSWLWYRRFIGYEQLSAVRSSIHLKGATVSLVLHGGEEVRLPLAGFLTIDLGREELSLRVRRIEQAVEASRRAQADRGVPLPPRGEQPARHWLRALRAVGTGAAADHRRAPIEPDTLHRIAEDPGSDPERRVAAAVALGGALDAVGRARLRVAASTTVAPELREALELAADEQASEEALAAALERVSAKR